MGHYLKIYMSKTVTVEEVTAWMEDKAYEAIKMPTPEQKMMIDKVNKAAYTEANSWDHGLKCARTTFEFLCGCIHVINDDLIERVRAASKMQDCPLQHMDEVMAEHRGALIWGWVE